MTAAATTSRRCPPRPCSWCAATHHGTTVCHACCHDGHHPLRLATQTPTRTTRAAATGALVTAPAAAARRCVARATAAWRRPVHSQLASTTTAPGSCYGPAPTALTSRRDRDRGGQPERGIQAMTQKARHWHDRGHGCVVDRPRQRHRSDRC
jgi:hypothetical protein